MNTTHDGQYIVPRRSTAATLSLLFGVLGPLAIVAGPLGIRAGLLRPLPGFLLSGSGLILGSLLAILCGLVGLIRTRAGTGRAGRGRAWLGILLGILLGLVASGLALRAPKVPRIHDITTNPDDPPAFTQAAKHPDNAGRDLSYPHGGPEVTSLQRQAYPDLAPIQLPVPPAEAFARAQSAAAELGWTVTHADPQAGLLEAVHETSLFRFADDIAVRVRPAAEGAVVDVRSTSRVGKSDIGVNARRIRQFAEALRR